MKKFFRRLLLLIIVALVIYFLVSSIIIVPENYTAIVKTKTSGILKKKFTKKVNFVWQKGIPFNAQVLLLPLNEQTTRFEIKNKIIVFHREIENVQLGIILNWKIKKQRFIKIAQKFNSVQEIKDYFKNVLQDFLDSKIDYIISHNIDFRAGLKNIEEDFFDILKSQIQDKGIEILKLEVIPRHIPYLLKVENIRSYAERLAEFQIIGKYIKNNPLILKYLLIQKIDKNTSLTIIPDSREWYGNRDKKSSGKK